MASTMHRQRWISSCARVFSGALGFGLLGLLLTASLSWAQLPPPPPPPPTGIIIFQVTIIAPESGQVDASDCFRLDPTTGAFTSDVLSGQGFPNGFWYAFSLEQDLPSLFTAHVTAIATSSDGQPCRLPSPTAASSISKVKTVASGRLFLVMARHFRIKRRWLPIAPCNLPAQQHKKKLRQVSLIP
jgi:hypothetical protein